jgi:hypothetical protein
MYHLGPAADRNTIPLPCTARTYVEGMYILHILWVRRVYATQYVPMEAILCTEHTYVWYITDST